MESNVVNLTRQFVERVKNQVVMYIMRDGYNFENCILGVPLQKQPHHADDGHGLQLPGSSRLVYQLGQVLTYCHHHHHHVWFFNWDIIIITNISLGLADQVGQASFSSPNNFYCTR